MIIENFVTGRFTKKLHSKNNSQINSSSPGQNGRHTDDILKRIFLNENIKISIKFSLNFVPKGPIDNILAMV